MPYADPEVRRARCRAYYYEHKEAIAAQNHARYVANSEINKEKSRQYREDHPDRVLASRQRKQAKHGMRYAAEAMARRLADHEAYKIKRRASYQRHRDRILAYAREYRKTNLAYRLTTNVKRRARLRNAPVIDLTRAQWEGIKKAYQYRCVYCHQRPKRLTQDHITPISQGGSHTLWNVVPACQQCNSSKKDRSVLCPVQPLLLLEVAV